VIAAAEVQGAVDGGLGDVGRLLGTDENVAEFARAGFIGKASTSVASSRPRAA
jgi:hypothetical protein